MGVRDARGKRILLASASPRRRELLRMAGIAFKVVKSRVNEAEKGPVKRTPASGAVHLATKKALDVAAQNRASIVLGADTIVVVDRKILGKPGDFKNACRMLELLSGRWHEVISGVAVVQGSSVYTGSVRTRVKFRELTAHEIEDYVASGEPLDKAGGYAVQGMARVFVERIEGDYTNMVGLPINLVITLLSKL